MCDFANLPAIHAAMAHVHKRVLGFQWITPQPTELAASSGDEPNAVDPRTDAPHYKRRAGMGRIPPLPRPKFLSALAEFALGEYRAASPSQRQIVSSRSSSQILSRSILQRAVPHNEHRRLLKHLHSRKVGASLRNIGLAR